MSDNILDKFLSGLPEKINKPAKKADKPAKETPAAVDENFDEFQKVTLSVRKKYYNSLKMESIRQDRFVWQVLDDAIREYLKNTRY